MGAANLKGGNGSRRTRQRLLELLVNRLGRRVLRDPEGRRLIRIYTPLDKTSLSLGHEFIADTGNRSRKHLSPPASVSGMKPVLPGSH